VADAPGTGFPKRIIPKKMMLKTCPSDKQSADCGD
jgi:hypothetical protein